MRSREGLGDAQSVSGEENCHILCGQCAENVLDHFYGGRIEADHRLINHQHPWLM